MNRPYSAFLSARFKIYSVLLSSKVIATEIDGGQ